MCPNVPECEDALWTGLPESPSTSLVLQDATKESHLTPRTCLSVASLLNPVLPVAELPIQEANSVPSGSVLPLQIAEAVKLSDVAMDADEHETPGDKADSEIPILNAFSLLRREHLVLQKHKTGTKRMISEVGRDDNETGISQERKVGKKSRSAGGQSKSAVWERLQNEKSTQESLSDKNEELSVFSAKIFVLDRYSKVVTGKTVRHHKCGKQLQMKYAYNVQNFKTHIVNCSGPSKSTKLPSGGMQSIDGLFQNQRNLLGVTTSHCSTTRDFPCPGLSEDDSSKIGAYLERTGAHGGGTSSVSVIADELYGKKYQQLSKLRKVQVKIAQKQEWSWTNDVDSGRVFSTNCLSKAGGTPTKVQPCLQCSSLWKNKQFKNAIQVPSPPDENYKYVNHEYRNKALAVLYS